MSYVEDLCYQSLQIVLKPTTILKNYRPDFLKNDTTGKNLEYDFYLEEYKVALEIQGDHHYTDDYQIEKDELKIQLAYQNRDRLILLSLNQIKPAILWKKLHILAKTIPFNRDWLTCDLTNQIQMHSSKLQMLYPSSIAFRSPKINFRIEFKNKLLRLYPPGREFKLNGYKLIVEYHDKDKLICKSPIGNTVRVGLKQLPEWHSEESNGKLL